MFKALILLIAICPIQQRVEKIRLKYVEPNTVMQQLHLAGPSAVLPVGIYQVVFDPTDNSIIVKGEADAIAQLKAAIARLDVDSAGKVVPIKNVAAQFMLERLVGTPSEPIASLLPAGVTIAVDPSRNALLVRGTSEGIREAEQLISLLDVLPATVALDVSGSIISINRNFSSSAVVANASSWTYEDKSSQTRIRIRPIINGDGSVTIVFVGGVFGEEATFSLGLRAGQYTAIQVLRKSQLDSGAVPTIYTIGEGGPEPKFDVARFLKGLDNPKGQHAPMDGELRIVIRAKVQSD